MISNRTSLFGRRDFLRIGSLGALGISLDGVLRAGAKRDISCILLWQSGGCGHLDTFDLKPDAPKEIRGEFKPIPTNVPGIQICEHLPFTARQADKLYPSHEPRRGASCGARESHSRKTATTQSACSVGRWA